MANKDKAVEKEVEAPVTQNVAAPVTLADLPDTTGSDSAVHVTTSKNAHVISGFYDFGKDLGTAVEKFGEAAVFSLVQRQAKVDLQSTMRKFITAFLKEEGEEGKKGIADQIPAAFAEYKPSADRARNAAAPKIVSQASVLKTAENMAPEELEALIAKLTKM